MAPEAGLVLFCADILRQDVASRHLRVIVNGDLTNNNTILCGR